jgi:hypothetical protein|tara:strand:+ start:377 stop:544 length:168 start_codon:yes stop_codon:yes gene_type:complete
MNERKIMIALDIIEIRELRDQLSEMTLESTKKNRQIISRMQNLVDKIIQADNNQG